MSKPMLIPPGKIRFLHPHLGGVSFEEEGSTPHLVPVLYCESFRPMLDYFPASKAPFENMPIRAWTPCGQEIYWRLK